MDTNTTITPQNIVNRYLDFVHVTATSDVAWNMENWPFPEFGEQAVLYFESGNRQVNINGSAVSAAGNLINPQDIYNALIIETYNYTNLRNLRAILSVGGGGGNTGTRPAPGIVFDETRKAHLLPNYRQWLGPLPLFGYNTDASMPADFRAGETITVAGLEDLFDRLRSSYNNVATTTLPFEQSVCHASCHSSCHGSRGRR
jgi:hypothetical protein